MEVYTRDDNYDGSEIDSHNEPNLHGEDHDDVAAEDRQRVKSK
jgi:hypothetical protein